MGCGFERDSLESLTVLGSEPGRFILARDPETCGHVLQLWLPAQESRQVAALEREMVTLKTLRAGQKEGLEGQSYESERYYYWEELQKKNLRG